MNFEQYKFLKAKALELAEQEGSPTINPQQLNPILLAYIGDAVFSLYVRMRLLPLSSHVRVLHDLGARMVSAVMQAKAMDAIVDSLNPEESVIVRRGRNAKSSVPKSATVREYRQGTAFEALIGWLFLTEQEMRLEELLERSFLIIRAETEKK
ncbi:MAG TPA: ribonuclease III [Candidatus Avacidaminococcus intestinavium]|uniref:Mini-ribonuclease 3 n=1 Tax=Candidatus Avacidaminococcus intestinavium TaxID=2840684 RepID=A0A9D1SL15_9FIRM|nr:ribonuclease III [Candidatus Avacidaminococcus intestinavium]